ncbi:YdaU family protein [Thioalkalivibrio sp. ALE12]|uniref:YdaU family protein n=1 Tax=Thioalkalivibrio sp. ALE12 TaxID=1158170 RepID=UPI00036B370A|nr:YdaU family protein [Thioalkalivibrio sp. ALE12]
MNHYRHHIGDYRKDTSHLSLLEHGVYRQAIDLYYLSESPLPSDMQRLMRLLCVRTADEERALCAVLEDFFTLTNEGYEHARCKRELEAIYEKSEKARESAQKRWGKEKQDVTKADAQQNEGAMRTHSEGNAKAMLPSNPVPSNPVPKGKDLLDGSDEPTDTKGQPEAKRNESEYPPEFEALWAQYPKRGGDNPQKKAFKAYTARLRKGVTHEDMMAGVMRYAAYCEQQGKVGTEFVKQAATFLGPDEHWREEYRPPAKPTMTVHNGGLKPAVDNSDVARRWAAKQGGVA